VYCPALRGAMNLYPIESIHDYGERTTIMSNEIPGAITETEFIELLRVEGIYSGDDPKSFIAGLIEKDKIKRLRWIDGITYYFWYPIMKWIENGAA
jgi:hypothetical protein